MNSSWRITWTRPRITRAVPGQLSRPITSTSLVNPLPIIATTTTATSSLGRIWNASVMRISTSSSAPPKKPASMPMLMPSPTLRVALNRPISSETRPP